MHKRHKYNEFSIRNIVTKLREAIEKIETGDYHIEECARLDIKSRY